MKVIDTEQLRKEIKKTNASLFRVSFVKANGEHRTMYAKTGIKRHLSKNPNKRVVKNVNQDIVRVYDCQSKSYKSFKLSSVFEFVGNNKVLK
ncbi:MAG: SH3 beta-barrel fold-containing protein [Cellulosilyticaceae bacterium]